MHKTGDKAFLFKYDIIMVGVGLRLDNKRRKVSVWEISWSLGKINSMVQVMQR